jgi:hypothetical protein
MADPYHHALSSVKRWGGDVDDYVHIHRWFDEPSKHHHGDFRHRAMRHHTQGIAECIARFGPTVTLANGKVVPTRWVAEQHVSEDLGRIPTLSDWLRCIEPAPWMNAPRQLSRELEESK